MIQINRHKQVEKYDSDFKKWSDHLANDLELDVIKQTAWDIDIDDIDTTPISNIYSTSSLLDDFDNDSLDFDDLI